MCVSGVSVGSVCVGENTVHMCNCRCVCVFVVDERNGLCLVLSDVGLLFGICVRWCCVC